MVFVCLFMFCIVVMLRDEEDIFKFFVKLEVVKLLGLSD